VSTRPADPRRQRAERAGRRAETIALWYLRLKLYRLLARRYRTSAGEIDLVMKHGRAIVFVG
jgi:putative endonuclease